MEVRFLLKKLLKSYFDEIFFGEREFLFFPNCALGSRASHWDLHKFTLTVFRQTFRESNVFTKAQYENAISKFFPMKTIL